MVIEQGRQFGDMIRPIFEIMWLNSVKCKIATNVLKYLIPVLIHFEIDIFGTKSHE